jgi:pimeloyl-ACP methyl ester carboxylesterase
VLLETVVTVCRDPRVDLFVAEAPGPPDRTLLVIHGGPDWDHTYLREPLQQLAGRHRVLWTDLRGCGRSTTGLADQDYNPDAAVSDLLALLDHYAPAETIDVLGFSYGGCIAQRLAIAAPQRLRRLVLASTTLLPVPEDSYDAWPERQQLAKTASAVWDTSVATGAELTREAAQVAAPLSVWRREVRAEWDDRLAAIRFSAEWLKPLRAGTLQPAFPENSPAHLAALDIPILLLHGRQDMTFPAALAQKAGRLIPRAQCVVLDDAGHMAHVDQPTHWLAVVRDFL